MLDEHILDLVRKHFPNIAEKALQEEIATVGKVTEFSAGTVIMDVGGPWDQYGGRARRRQSPRCPG